MRGTHKTKSCRIVVKWIVTDNFMVVIQKVVTVTTQIWYHVKTDVITGTTPDNPKVVNRWQLIDNSMTTLWHPFVLCACWVTWGSSKIDYATLVSLLNVLLLVTNLKISIIWLNANSILHFIFEPEPDLLVECTCSRILWT